MAFCSVLYVICSSFAWRLFEMCTDKLVNKILDYFLNICSIRNKRKTDSDILAT